MRARAIIILVVLAGTIGTALWLFTAGPKPSTTVSAVNDAVTKKPLPLLTGAANLVTPLGKGYVYHDKLTSGLFYSDASGTQELTAAVLITPDSAPSLTISSDAIYNTIINVQPIASGDVIVTTTRNIFLIHSPTQITKLRPYEKDTLNFTASAYDNKTNSLFVLSAFSKLILRYNLGQPTADPAVTYTMSREANRIAAGGGKIVVYFDDIPSIESAVITEYAKTRQISPVIIDAQSSKLLKTLDDFRPATYVGVSGSGKFIAFKKKFSDTIGIYNFDNGTTVNIPRYDTSGGAWQGDTFYVARDRALLSYDAAGKATSLNKVADVATPVTHVLTTTDQIVLETNDDRTALLAPLDTAQLTLTIDHPATYPQSRSVYLVVPNNPQP